MLYLSIYVPTLTYGHKLWLVTLKNEVAHTGRVQVLFLHIERRQLRQNAS